MIGLLSCSSHAPHCVVCLTATQPISMMHILATSQHASRLFSATVDDRTLIVNEVSGPYLYRRRTSTCIHLRFYRPQYSLTRTRSGAVRLSAHQKKLHLACTHASGQRCTTRSHTQRIDRYCNGFHLRAWGYQRGIVHNVNDHPIRVFIGYGASSWYCSKNTRDIKA